MDASWADWPVDIHIHVPPPGQMAPEALRMLTEGRADGEAIAKCFASPAGLVEFLDSERLSRVGVINYVAPEIMGFDAKVNDLAATYRDGAPERIIAFGGVHPPACPDVKAEMRRLLDDLALDGIKIHPPHQDFPANAYRDGSLPALAHVYEACEERGVPLMVHTGTSVFPGARSKWGDPMPLDDVALDFPNLTIILAHGGRPIWTEAAFFLIRRHKNILFDISGIPPTRLLEWFPKFAQVAEKALFGTDWPSMGVKGIRQNLDAILALPLTDEAKTAISHGNANRLFP
ncbi:amidohydrolase, partial [bacterium]|nr:amidohydrolase [bacterium]